MTRMLSLARLLSLALAAGAAGRVDFFLCDHDAPQAFPDQLSRFIASHEVLFLDLAPPNGRESGLHYQRAFRRIASGGERPENIYSPEFRRLNKDRSAALVEEVAKLVHGTGKTVYTEAASWSERESAEIGRLWRDGSPAARERRLDMRDELMLRRLLELRVRHPAAAIGVIAGAFHTWPHLQLKARGIPGEAEFAPRGIADLRPHSHRRPSAAR